MPPLAPLALLVQKQCPENCNISSEQRWMTHKNYVLPIWGAQEVCTWALSLWKDGVLGTDDIIGPQPGCCDVRQFACLLRRGGALVVLLAVNPQKRHKRGFKKLNKNIIVHLKLWPTVQSGCLYFSKVPEKFLKVGRKMFGVLFVFGPVRSCRCR